MSHTPRYPLARASTSKDQLLAFAIARQSVMECDPSYLLNLLKDISSTRQQVIDHEGVVTFYFDGWDADPRETAEIPEIRAYFAALNKGFPYWLHYVEKVDDTLFHILRLLCAGHYERKRAGFCAWRFDDPQQMSTTLLTLFGHMNVLHDRFDIPELTNRRISEEVAQLIECSLE